MSMRPPNPRPRFSAQPSPLAAPAPVCQGCARPDAQEGNKTMPHITETLALIVVVGLAAQWLGWRLRIPAIVLLSLFGLLVGPVLGIIRPSVALGDTFQPLISARRRGHPVRRRAHPAAQRAEERGRRRQAPDHGGGGPQPRPGLGRGPLCRRPVLAGGRGVRRNRGGDRPDGDSPPAPPGQAAQASRLLPQMGGHRERPHRGAAGGGGLRVLRQRRAGEHRPQPAGAGPRPGCRRGPGRRRRLAARAGLSGRPGAGVPQGPHGLGRRPGRLCALEPGAGGGRPPGRHGDGAGAGQHETAEHQRDPSLQGEHGGPAGVGDLPAAHRGPRPGDHAPARLAQLRAAGGDPVSGAAARHRAGDHRRRHDLAGARAGRLDRTPRRGGRRGGRRLRTSPGRPGLRRGRAAAAAGVRPDPGYRGRCTASAWVGWRNGWDSAPPARAVS